MWHVPPLALASRWVGSKRVTLPIPKYSKDDVLLLERLMEAGRYRGVIDRRYPLEDVVEATRYVETGPRPATSSSPWRETTHIPRDVSIALGLVAGSAVSRAVSVHPEVVPKVPASRSASRRKAVAATCS